MIYLVLFFTFFVIGLFSFGGGAGMMALIEQEVVTNHQWMSSPQLYQFIGIAESTPGPIAVNIATAVGFSQAGALGAMCSTVGVILPSFIVICIIACFFTKLMNNKYIKAFIDGIKPVVLALMVVMTIKIISISIFNSFSYYEKFSLQIRPLIITTILLIIYLFVFKVFKKKIPPIILIVLSIVLGIVVYL